jgi:hypothetical protein
VLLTRYFRIRDPCIAIFAVMLLCRDPSFRHLEVVEVEVGVQSKEARGSEEGRGTLTQAIFDDLASV